MRCTRISATDTTTTVITGSIIRSITSRQRTSRILKKACLPQMYTALGIIYGTKPISHKVLTIKGRGPFERRLARRTNRSARNRALRGPRQRAARPKLCAGRPEKGYPPRSLDLLADGLRNEANFA